MAKAGGFHRCEDGLNPSTKMNASQHHDLTGRVALITGAARGLGLEMAKALAAAGASVAMCDVLAEEGRAAAAELNNTGFKADFLALDVSSEEQWQTTVDAVASCWERPTILINNAAVNDRLGIMASNRVAWDRTLGINLTGAFLGMRAVVPGMRALGGGSIVNVSSTSGLVGHTDAAYSASKWAIRGLSKTAAIEFADDGIRVNSLHPGSVPTGMHANTPPGHAAIWRKLIPMARAGHASEIAAAALFLASDASSYMTGTELVVDGGLSQGGLMTARRRLLAEFAKGSTPE